ncbi:MAG: methyltransferase domain-containing protein [Thermoplasmata archaeon]|nr:MAG: methyltransferase domain-containing protein [Thermoplasmata archaeon]
MKKKELEIALQKIPPIESPSPSLEQYSTPAEIAADILFNAYEDIYRKKVIDLGCGTGIFAIGSALLGAREVIGIDIDDSAIKIARREAERFSLKNISFVEGDIESMEVNGDVAIMNPPFGSQMGNRNADRAFLKKGLEFAPVVYSLHLKSTIPFIKILASSLGGEITYSRDYDFPIKRTFSFHKKRAVVYEVTLVRTARLQR